jgi:hypothetical protein
VWFTPCGFKSHLRHLLKKLLCNALFIGVSTIPLHT